jgi:hypothetical protein
MFKRQDIESTDLEKCLFVSLEKISESFSSDNMEKSKDYVIIIMGASGGRIDHTYSAFSQVFKYIENYKYQFNGIEIMLLSKSSCSVYLRSGKNKIFTSSCWEKKSEGYSVIPINGECQIEIIEDDKSIFYIQKSIKFGEKFFFRKNHNANIVYINVGKLEESPECIVIYSFTTIFHNN